MKSFFSLGLPLLLAFFGPACKPAGQAEQTLRPDKLSAKNSKIVSPAIFSQPSEPLWLAQVAEFQPADRRPETIRRWSEEDAPAAAGWALRLPAGPVRNSALEQVALAWAGRDLPGAFAWAARLPADAPVSFLLSTLAIEVSRTDPVAALDVAAQLPASPVRDELFRHAIGEWSVTNPQAADRWAQSVQEEPLRSTLLRALAAVSATRGSAAPALENGN